jgi:hypothetical protein
MTEPRRKNGPPRHIWEALLRLRACNKGQLAAALGVDRHTLARWITATEAGESPGTNAETRAADLLQTTLRAASDADVHAQWRVNWDAIDRIGGRR